MTHRFAEIQKVDASISQSITPTVNKLQEENRETFVTLDTAFRKISETYETLHDELKHLEFVIIHILKY